MHTNLRSTVRDSERKVALATRREEQLIHINQRVSNECDKLKERLYSQLQDTKVDSSNRRLCHRKRSITRSASLTRSIVGSPGMGSSSSMDTPCILTPPEGMLADRRRLPTPPSLDMGTSGMSRIDGSIDSILDHQSTAILSPNTIMMGLSLEGDELIYR